MKPWPRSPGLGSMSKRRMRSVGPAGSRARPTGSSDGVKASSQSTHCHTMGLARGWLPPPFEPPAVRAPEEVADGGAAPFPPCRCGVMPERRTARRHRPRIGGRVRHRVVAKAKAYPDGVPTSNVLAVVAVEPSAGGSVLSAECGCWWQVLRVRLTLGVAGHEIAVRPDTALVAHVASALAVAPRPAEPGRRSALLGRGWE